MTISLKQATAAQKKIEQIAEENELWHPQGPINGIGIGRSGKGGKELDVAVLLSKDVKTSQLGLPEEVDGVPIRFRLVGKIKKH